MKNDFSNSNKKKTINKFQLQLLSEGQLDKIESKMTSVSSKKGHASPLAKGGAAGSSLQTVLIQSLNADDGATLDWILGQKDQDMITGTLGGLKSSKHIESFFRYIVQRFQQELADLGDQESLAKWFKTALTLFYPQIIRSSSK